MSDGKNLYVLKQPVTSEQYDRWSYVMSEQVFNEAFTPLDVEAKRQQIADIMDELGDYRDVEAYFRKQEEAIDAVLRVCGLTQEETDV